MFDLARLFDVTVELAGELEHAGEVEQVLSVIEDVLASIHGCALDDLTAEPPGAREPSDSGLAHAEQVCGALDGEEFVLGLPVIYGQTPCSLLMHLGLTEAVYLHWTEAILDECFDNLITNRPDLDPDKLARTRALMLQHQPRAMVEEYEHLIEELVLPDPQDRHVLAAAIHADIGLIVTNNIKDFPTAAHEPYGMERVRPDGLVNRLLDRAPGRVIQAVANLQQARKRPPRSMDETLDLLGDRGFSTSVARLRHEFGL